MYKKKRNQEQIKAYDNRKYFPHLLGRAAASIEMKIHLENEISHSSFLLIWNKWLSIKVALLQSMSDSRIEAESSAFNILIFFIHLILFKVFHQPECPATTIVVQLVSCNVHLLAWFICSSLQLSASKHVQCSFQRVFWFMLFSHFFYMRSYCGNICVML